MRSFHFLDAICLFVMAASILLETGSTSSGNAKPNADASPKTSTTNTKLENEPAEQENPGLTPENRWDSDASDKGLTLSEPDQLIAEYPGEPWGPRSVSAEQPIPKIKSGIFYYEVKILAREFSNPIYIGLGPTKGIPRGKVIGRIEGGYAYDDKGRFWGHEVKGCHYSTFTKRPYVDGQPPFAKFVRSVVNDVVVEVFIIGDVIGCGVNLKTRQIIYTRNGVLLKTTGLLVDSDADLFPNVSLSAPGSKIEANFGPKDFKFNINDLI
uniref:B30.2/SPRY domain-containing protein n=1 Tax=Globodera pallida TaxID=36090 RepID=A0A183C274_GLOPA